MTWSPDAKTLFIFIKDTLEIRVVRDSHLDKCKTAYERTEVEFSMLEVHRLQIEE